MARRLLLLRAMRWSVSMKVAAMVLAGLTAWGTSLARADEAPDSEPSVTVLTPGPTAAPTAAPSAPLPAASTGTPASAGGSAVSPGPPKAGPVLVPAPPTAAASLREGGVAVSQRPRSRPSYGPGPGVAPPETGLAVSQVFIGSFATFGAGVLLALVGAGANSAPVALVGVGAAPAVGSLVVCGMGRTSKHYQGGCGPTIVGGYLGAILLAIPMGYVGAATLAPSISDGGTDRAVGAVLGAALGVVVGTGIGATLAWHVSKHARERPAPLALGAPLAPPAALAAWSELGARPAAARAPVAVGVPLLSLRF